jgi:hypothetical protein
MRNGLIFLRSYVPLREPGFLSWQIFNLLHEKKGKNVTKQEEVKKIFIFFSAEYPWQVAILKKEEFDNVYVCGGALIDGSHILTAAHSIKDYKPEDLRYLDIFVLYRNCILLLFG